MVCLVCIPFSWYGVCRPSWTHLTRGREKSALHGMTGAMQRRGELPSLPKHWPEPSSLCTHSSCCCAYTHRPLSSQGSHQDGGKPLQSAQTDTAFIGCGGAWLTWIHSANSDTVCLKLAQQGGAASISNRNARHEAVEGLW